MSPEHTTREGSSLRMSETRVGMGWGPAQADHVGRAARLLRIEPPRIAGVPRLGPLCATLCDYPILDGRWRRLAEAGPQAPDYGSIGTEFRFCRA